MNKKLLIINYCVAAAFLAVVFSRVDFGSAVSSMLMADYRFLAVAVLISIIFRLVLFPALWQRVIAYSGLAADYGDLFLVNAGSLPLKYVLPFKLTEIARAAGLKVFGKMDFQLALSSVVYVKGSVIAATLIMLAAGALISGRTHWAALIMCLGVAGMLIIRSIPQPQGGNTITRIVEQLMFCFTKLSSGRKAEILVYALLFQMGEVISSALILFACGLHMSFEAIAYYISLAMLASTIPVSVQGLGIRESVLMVSLAGAAPQQTLLAVGLLIFLTHHLAPALVGLLAWVVDARGRIFAFGITANGEAE